MNQTGNKEKDNATERLQQSTANIGVLPAQIIGTFTANQ
jgi:hypothetical protein